MGGEDERERDGKTESEETAMGDKGGDTDSKTMISHF